MSSQYRSYHSGLKLQFADGKLQPDITRTIPRSTKQRWKGKNIKSFWTPYPISDSLSDDYLLQRLKKENAILKVQVRSLFYLVTIYKELVVLFPVKSIQVLAVRKSIDRLLRYYNENGSDNLIWRYLPFSFKQWKVWSGQRHCLNSLQGLCRRQNPQQLSVSEQEIIRIECSNKEYENWPLNSIYYQLLREKKINCCQSTFYKYCPCVQDDNRHTDEYQASLEMSVHARFFVIQYNKVPFTKILVS